MYGTYWGMNMLWWFFWIILLAAIFFTPWKSGRSSKENLLHTLRKTYAEGRISTEEYEERKRFLEKEFEKGNRKDVKADKNENV